MSSTIITILPWALQIQGSLSLQTTRLDLARTTKTSSVIKVIYSIFNRISNISQRQSVTRSYVDFQDQLFENVAFSDGWLVGWLLGYLTWFFQVSVYLLTVHRLGRRCGRMNRRITLGYCWNGARSSPAWPPAVIVPEFLTSRGVSTAHLAVLAIYTLFSTGQGLFDLRMNYMEQLSSHSI